MWSALSVQHQEVGLWLEMGTVIAVDTAMYMGCLYSLDWTTRMTSELELCSFRESESRENLILLYGDGFSDSEMRSVTGC